MTPGSDEEHYHFLYLDGPPNFCTTPWPAGINPIHVHRNSQSEKMLVMLNRLDIPNYEGQADFKKSEKMENRNSFGVC